MGQDNDHDDDKYMEDVEEEASQEETIGTAPNKKRWGWGWGPTEAMKGLFCHFIKVKRRNNNNYQACMHYLDYYNRQHKRCMEGWLMQTPVAPKSAR
jgi:hypothetical protein